MAGGRAKGQAVNRTGLAGVFGVSLPTIDIWIKQGCPVVERGGRGREWLFDTADVAKWRTDRAVTDATGDTVGDELELKRRRLAADTAVAELGLAKAKSLVAPLDQVERTLSKVFAEVRANLRNIPGRTAALLLGETDERRFKEVLSQEIDLALEALANADLCGDDESPDTEEDEAA